jgi:hypothetical protein
MSTQEPDHFHQLASLFADPVRHDHDVTHPASPPWWRAGARDGVPTTPVVRWLVSHAGFANGGDTPEQRRSSRGSQLKPFRTHRRIRPIMNRRIRPL